MRGQAKRRFPLRVPPEPPVPVARSRVRAERGGVRRCQPPGAVPAAMEPHRWLPLEANPDVSDPGGCAGGWLRAGGGGGEKGKALSRARRRCGAWWGACVRARGVLLLRPDRVLNPPPSVFCSLFRSRIR